MSSASAPSSSASSARSRSGRMPPVSACGEAPYAAGSRSFPPDKTKPSNASSVSETPSSSGGTRSARPPARSTDRTYANGIKAASARQCPHTASSTYVVIPTTGLATLEHPLPLVAGHDLVEEPLLGPRVVQVVVDDLVAQSGPGHRTRLQRRDRLAQRPWEPLRVRHVRVPLQRRRQRQLPLDPVQPGRDQRRERQIRIDVAARDPRIDPQPRPATDDAEPTRAVVVPPGERRRRPR